MKDKKIFISGGAGVIGNELVKKLYTLGANIYVGDLKSKPDDWPKEILYRQGDLNFITQEEIELFEPNVFIHLAATFERSTETYDFWDENYWHNVRLSHYLMTLMKDLKSLQRVIFASSYLIYNPELYLFNSSQDSTYRLQETDNIYPRNLTGVAKLNHEIELRFLNDFKQDNYSIVNTRIFRGYGKGSKCVVSRWIRDLLDGKKIKVYKKEGRFDFIYAEEIANGLIKLVDNPNIRGIINLGNDNARKIEDVLLVLKKYFPEMKYDEIDSDIKYEASQANMDLFKQKTGWIPSMQIEDAIPLIIEFEKARKQSLSKVEFKNILATSISKKYSFIKNLKQAAKKINPEIKLFGGDYDNNCTGKNFVDEFWRMPKLEELNVDDLIDFCLKNNVGSIIPSRDGELSFFAINKDILNNKGIHVMISDEDTINLCSDKIAFYERLNKDGFPAIPSYLNINNAKCSRLVVKERYGAGSSNLGLNVLKDEALEIAQKLKCPIFQPFISGKEISVDLYIDKNTNVKGVVCRSRDVVINGESFITTTFPDENIENLCSEIANKYNFYGHILFQILIDKENNLHIIECNPRFGGASNLSMFSGLDSFYWFLLESSGVDISNYPFAYNKNRKLKQTSFLDHKIQTL